MLVPPLAPDSDDTLILRAVEVLEIKVVCRLARRVLVTAGRGRGGRRGEGIVLGFLDAEDVKDDLRIVRDAREERATEDLVRTMANAG